ncbi:hypothetical protein [Marilutibacter spongiae]|uniref:Uncharacterized protein n=1 Tax=Marilutibacter spongiae TaxID=2025720 RepID=A0A7W3Y5E7_9GAMM|nr:hypothetical protein [Lysobacter spongiae]MBB1060388.1 hypothetical protein [Lysobacter spongiae]
MSSLVHIGCDEPRHLSFNAELEFGSIVLWIKDGGATVSVTMSRADVGRLQAALNAAVDPRNAPGALPSPRISDIACPAAPVPYACPVNQSNEE